MKKVKLYSEYALPRLIDFLRASNYYSLEQAFEVCKERDLVPEMVFLLGKMGNNKQALTLIIERLGDVQRVGSLDLVIIALLITIQAIEFAKEQNDDDLWEDLLRYSETRPSLFCTTIPTVHPVDTRFSVYTRLVGECRRRDQSDQAHSTDQEWA